MRRAVLVLALVAAACGADPVAEPAPAPPPAPAPAPAPVEPEPEPAEPDPVALTAELAASGDTVTVTGTSSLPDGAQLMWELVGLDTTAEQRELLYAAGRLEGTAQVDGGTYSATVTGDGWGTLELCDALGLELWVGYSPADGEQLAGAVPPAELVELPTPAGAQRVELVVTCP